MKKYQYTLTFKGGKITVTAFTYVEAEILAKAEAIKNAWDYTVISWVKES